MMRLLRWTLLIALVVLGAWYWSAPRRSYDNFLRAVAYGDAAGLEATVDFPVLRMHLREDIQEGLQRRGGNNLGINITGAFLGTLVDAAVSPDGLSEILTGFGTRSGPLSDSEIFSDKATASYKYRSLSKVEVVMHPASDPQAIGGILTFERRGLSWKLTRARGKDQT